MLRRRPVDHDLDSPPVDEGATTAAAASAAAAAVAAFPAGLTRRQRVRWYDDLLRRHELETSAVVDAATLVAAAAGPVAEPEPKPVRPRWWMRLHDLVMNRRHLLTALSIVLFIDLLIVLYQIGYYRALPGMRPEILGFDVRLYLGMPLVGEGVVLFFGMLAAQTVQTDTGRYRVYLRFMWLFSGINAVINASHAVDSVDDVWSPAGLTAVYLGGLSLISPLVWHSYVGFSIAAKSGMSIAEMQRLARQCTRHPVLALKTARARDAFPEMTRDAVWMMVVASYRQKLTDRYTVKKEPVAESTPPVNDPGPDRPRGERTGGVQTDAVNESRPGLLRRLRVVAPSTNTSTDVVNNVREPAVTRPVNKPASAGERSPVDNRPVGRASAGERSPAPVNSQDVVVRAWFEMFGDHLDTPGVPVRGWQKQVAAAAGCSPAMVSKTFRRCEAGEFTNPFVREFQPAKGAV